MAGRWTLRTAARRNGRPGTLCGGRLVALDTDLLRSAACLSNVVGVLHAYSASISTPNAFSKRINPPWHLAGWRALARDTPDRRSCRHGNIVSLYKVGPQKGPGMHGVQHPHRFSSVIIFMIHIQNLSFFLLNVRRRLRHMQAPDAPATAGELVDFPAETPATPPGPCMSCRKASIARSLWMASDGAV